MPKNDWIRARTAKQKEERERTILSSALHVFKNIPYEKVTLLMIANKAGITRTNIYRYYKTREEIFLALYLFELDIWVKQIIIKFKIAQDLDTFVEIWTDILIRNETLLKLTPLFSVSLEKNTSEELLRKSKIEIRNQMEKVLPIIMKALPGMTSDKCISFFITHQALTAGIWPMTQFSENEKKVIESIKIQESIIDFKSFYKECIFYYLKGLLIAN